MKNIWRLGIAAILVTALIPVTSGAQTQQAPVVPAGANAFVAKVTQNKDCLAVHNQGNGSSEVVACLKPCKEVTLTGNSNKTWLEISAPVSGWVNGLSLDPNPKVCEGGRVTELAPYAGYDPSNVVEDYYDWWSGPYNWYSRWWWHQRHDRRHFFVHHHRGRHHGHYIAHHRHEREFHRAARHGEHHGGHHGGRHR